MWILLHNIDFRCFVARIFQAWKCVSVKKMTNIRYDPCFHQITMPIRREMPYYIVDEKDHLFIWRPVSFCFHTYLHRQCLLDTPLIFLFLQRHTSSLYFHGLFNPDICQGEIVPGEETSSFYKMLLLLQKYWRNVWRDLSSLDD